MKNKLKVSKLILTILSVLIFNFRANADLGFTNINESDFENIISDLSSNFLHTTVTGAGTQGSIFGFQVGLIGGLGKSPEIEKLSKQYDASSDVGSLLHGGLIGVVSVPFGISVEAMLMPSLKSEGGEFGNTGLAVKWTISDSIPLPIDVAIRGHYTKTDFKFSQVINSVNTEVDFANSSMGFQALAGLNLLMLKPYVGVGTITADADISVSGNQTIFDNTYTSASSASKKVTSSQFLIGTELSLLLIKFGLEYSSQFGTDRYTAKFAVGF